MSDHSICHREWATDRVVNEPASRSQLGPMWHMCNRDPHHDDQHQCECGARA